MTISGLRVLAGTGAVWRTAAGYVKTDMPMRDPSRSALTSAGLGVGLALLSWPVPARAGDDASSSDSSTLDASAETSVTEAGSGDAKAAGDTGSDAAEPTDAGGAADDESEGGPHTVPDTDANLGQPDSGRSSHPPAAEDSSGGGCAVATLSGERENPWGVGLVLGTLGIALRRARHRRE
jgi:hypothetical protein